MKEKEKKEKELVEKVILIDKVNGLLKRAKEMCKNDNYTLDEINCEYPITDDGVLKEELSTDLLKNAIEELKELIKMKLDELY